MNKGTFFLGYNNIIDLAAANTNLPPLFYSNIVKNQKKSNSREWKSKTERFDYWIRDMMVKKKKVVWIKGLFCGGYFCLLYLLGISSEVSEIGVELCACVAVNCWSLCLFAWLSYLPYILFVRPSAEVLNSPPATQRPGGGRGMKKSCARALIAWVSVLSDIF